MFLIEFDCDDMKFFVHTEAIARFTITTIQERRNEYRNIIKQIEQTTNERIEQDEDMKNLNSDIEAEERTPKASVIDFIKLDHLETKKQNRADKIKRIVISEYTKNNRVPDYFDDLTKVNIVYSAEDADYKITEIKEFDFSDFDCGDFPRTNEIASGAL